MCIRGDQCVYDIIGVVSNGINCGSSLPGFYTDVHHHLSWIESHVWPVNEVLRELVTRNTDSKLGGAYYIPAV
jgi:secreted trypsin-like serine protease